MTPSEWRLYDKLTVRFSKILYAMQFPETLAQQDPDPTATGDAIRSDMVHAYFQNNATAYHGLKTLVHAAVEEAKQVGMI